MKFFRFDKRSGEILLSKQKAARMRVPALTKKQLIKQIAAELKLSQREVHAVVSSALAAVANGLKDGHPVVLAGFGRFRPRKPQGGKLRNPKTGKPVGAAKYHSVSFRPSPVLRRFLG